MDILPAGLAAFYLQLPVPPGHQTSRTLQQLAHTLQASKPSGVRDIVLGYCSLLIEHDPYLEQASLVDWVQQRTTGELELPPPGCTEVQVHYGEAADRQELEMRLGLPWDTIVKQHHETTYLVAFIGFTPGYPYLLGLPEALHLPRRETPRKQIPAGAVAIAGAHAGIYPSASPGGWWVLGRTSLPLYRPGQNPPVTLRPGDEVRFVPHHPPPMNSEADEEGAAATQQPALQLGTPLLQVQEAWPQSATLQGQPRWGVGAYGLAQAGALDPLALEAGNRILGNDPDACGLELITHPLTLEALQSCTVCVTGGGFRVQLGGADAPRWERFLWPRNTPLRFVPDTAISGLSSYLCIAGGFQAHLYKDSYSTDMRGSVGGLQRALRSGDQLASAGHPQQPPRPYPGTPRYPARLTLRLYPGPQYEPEGFDRLVGSSFHVDSLDRMGARLSGPAIPLTRHDIVSEGSPWGAVQVPASGQPIILLADRGRTGGYAKPAVVDVRDLWKLAQAKPGTEVWFEAATASKPSP